MGELKYGFIVIEEGGGGGGGVLSKDFIRFVTEDLVQSISVT